jgi:hypothetical protein
MGSISPAAKSVPLSPEREKEEVLRWRHEQFRQLGLSHREADELAASEADLGQARYMLGCGCSLELALRILR